jgi:hypothetical protein
MHFVAFHTGGNYERHAAELVESALPFGVVVDVWRRPNLEDWCSNCSQKADFVLSCLEMYNEPIAYVDADARFRKRPDLILNMPPEADVAFHRLDGVELLSGTLYFSNSVQSIALAQDWKRRCTEQPGVWDQRHLDASVQSMPRLNVMNLPEEYCRIFDRWKRMAKEDIVIEHLQASRQNR